MSTLDLISSSSLSNFIQPHYVILACPESFFFGKIPDPPLAEE
jgi:hypothetical protein